VGRRLSFCAFALCWLLLPIAGNAVIYAVVDLGATSHRSCGSINPGVGEINESGMVVGSGCGAFVWGSESGLQRPGSLPGDTASFAYGLNSKAVVVGSSGYVDHPGPGVFSYRNRGAFVWSSATGIRALDMLSGTSDSVAFDINDAGYVVGASGSRGVLWSEADGIRDLGSLPGGGRVVARRINNAGVVVGTSGDRAFIWTLDDGMRDLGTLPGADSASAMGVNELGAVVGNSGIGAFVWTATDGMRSLGSLPGAGNSFAYDINDEGVIVGFSTGAGAFLWSPRGGMQSLNDLIAPSSGWILISAQAVNSRGQIAGWGLYSDLGPRAFLLEPLATGIPEPAGWSLLLTGLAIVGVLMRRPSSGTARI